MNTFDDEFAFRAAGSAAIAVLDHRATVIDMGAQPWTFERGTVSKDGRSRAQGEFTRASLLDVLLRDTLAITAMPATMGAWVMQHDVTRAR